MITIMVPVENQTHLLIHPQVIDGKVYRYVPSASSKFYKDPICKRLVEMLHEDLDQ